MEEIFIDTFSPPCAWGRGHRAAAEGSAGFLPAKTSTVVISIVDQLRVIVSPGVAFTLLQMGGMALGAMPPPQLQIQ